MGDCVMRTDFCVYLHARPDGSVFYVGKGVSHRPYRRTGRNMTWQAEVKKIGTFSVQIIASGLTEAEAFDKEVELIAEFRASGVVLTNQTKGGDGCKSLIFTEEIIHKLKAARAKQTPPMLGLKISDETKEKLSKLRSGENNPMFGKKHSEETKAKFKERPITKHWAGKTLANEVKEKMSQSHKALPKLTCPHCNKTGGSAGMRRNHFDYCKAIKVAL
jgi:hypothetical protein